jgi:hypothetical protein
MVDAYLRMQRALNADSLEAVVADSRIVSAEAGKLGAAGAAIHTPVRAIENARTLAAAQAAFRGVGDAIMRHAKEAGARFDDDVKVAFCPMANKRWLQKGDAIQNPFYGKAMSDCGRIIGIASEHK